MASNTENLNLLMKNPSADGADTFNVQTMLNDNWQKIDNNAGTVAQTLANILKPTTPPIIGLPPSTTPDGMFQALGNTGELHVWRKTVTNQQAGYDLSDVKTNGTLASGDIGYTRVILSSGSSVLVSSDGHVTIDNPNEQNFYATQSSGWPSLSGKFIKITGYAGDGSGSPSSANSDFQVGTILHIPSGGNIAHNGSGRIYLTKYQIVTGHGAGTTTTYPVSTNPNAYQEGDDAKEAGYTLGDVKTGSFAITSKSSPGGVGTRWNDSAALSVSDDGTCTLATTGGTYIDGTTTNAATTAKNELQGKFAYCNNADTDFASSVIVFFPSNTIFTKVGNIVYADRYQPVTSYAAIPAGTTIEYLGKLGDKARVQVVSYVGTGTYGSDHPNSLTFDFAPKLVIVALSKDKDNNPNVMPSPNQGWRNMFLWIYGMEKTTTSTSDIEFINDGKNFSWYAYNYASNQCNDSGSAYTAIAIG